MAAAFHNSDPAVKIYPREEEMVLATPVTDKERMARIYEEFLQSVRLKKSLILEMSRLTSPFGGEGKEACLHLQQHG